MTTLWNARSTHTIKSNHGHFLRQWVVGVIMIALLISLAVVRPDLFDFHDEK